MINLPEQLPARATAADAAECLYNWFDSFHDATRSAKCDDEPVGTSTALRRLAAKIIDCADALDSRAGVHR